MSDNKNGSSYTFDSFEVTKANSKAFEKAEQFAQNADSKPLAVFGGTAVQFREKYLQADVLLVDDIQELAGKEKTQDELLLLFNAFCESGKRFMMTSSQKKVYSGLSNRLFSRAFWGDSAEITTAYIKAEINTIGSLEL